MIYPYKVQLGDRLYLAGEDVPEVSEEVASGATPKPEDKAQPKPEKRRGRPPKK